LHFIYTEFQTNNLETKQILKDIGKHLFIFYILNTSPDKEKKVKKLSAKV